MVLPYINSTAVLSILLCVPLPQWGSKYLQDRQAVYLLGALVRGHPAHPIPCLFEALAPAPPREPRVRVLVWVARIPTLNEVPVPVPHPTIPNLGNFLRIPALVVLRMVPLVTTLTECLRSKCITQQ